MRPFYCVEPARSAGRVPRSSRRSVEPLQVCMLVALLNAHAHRKLAWPRLAARHWGCPPPSICPTIPVTWPSVGESARKAQQRVQACVALGSFSTRLPVLGGAAVDAAVFPHVQLAVLEPAGASEREHWEVSEYWSRRVARTHLRSVHLSKQAEVSLRRKGVTGECDPLAFCVRARTSQTAPRGTPSPACAHVSGSVHTPGQLLSCAARLLCHLERLALLLSGAQGRGRRCRHSLLCPL